MMQRPAKCPEVPDSPMPITCAREDDLSVEDFIDVLQRSGLAARRLDEPLQRARERARCRLRPSTSD